MMSELPKGWVESTIGEACLIENGLRKPISLKERANCQGDFPYYGATGVIDYLNSYTHEGEYVLIGEDGANLLSKSKPLAFIANGKYWVNNHAHTLRCLADSPNLYLEKYFNSLSLESWVTGSAQPKLTKKNLESIPYPLAPLAEQKRIVEKLDEVLAQVDTIKARLDGIPDSLKRFRQSVLASAVSGKLIAVKTPRLMTIGDVSEDIRYGTSKKCEYKGGDTPVIRIPNIGDRKLDVSDLKSADFTEKELEKLALKSGDLLVIRSNGSLDLVAKPALVESQYEGFLYAGYLIRIRCDREKVIPSFLLNVLSSRVVRDVVELGARSTSGVNNINSKELSALEFVLPSLEEQKEIVRLVDQYFAFADSIEAQVKKAQARVDNLTQSILAKAFRGELVEQDPSDEPADKLLERIAKARADAEALAKAAKKAEAAKKKAEKAAAKC